MDLLMGKIIYFAPNNFFFKKRIGGDHFNPYLGHQVKSTDCGIPCIPTRDRNKLSTVDAVIFEAQPFAGFTNSFVQSPPSFPQRYPDTIFVNTGYEQPHYFHLYAHPGFLVRFLKFNEWLNLGTIQLV